MRRIIPVEAKELTKLAVKALEDKKAEDIKVIDISNGLRRSDRTHFLPR